jgi:uncharacterized membrane protein
MFEDVGADRSTGCLNANELILPHEVMKSLVKSAQNLSSQTRLVWAIGLAIGIFLLLPSSLQMSTRLLSAWCVGAGYFLLLVMLMMKSATAEVTRDLSQRYGAHPLTVLVLPVVAASSSLFAIVFLISTEKDAPAIVITVHLGISALAIFCSWILIPIAFARRYATLYYHPSRDDPDADWNDEAAFAGGLLFVEENAPTYWDFLYFAFILAATAQTADTLILSRPMRRLALVQCLIAFFFFAGVLAMTVNTVTGVLAATHN